VSEGVRRSGAGPPARRRSDGVLSDSLSARSACTQASHVPARGAIRHRHFRRRRYTCTLRSSAASCSGSRRSAPPPPARAGDDDAGERAKQARMRNSVGVRDGAIARAGSQRPGSIRGHDRCRASADHAFSAFDSQEEARAEPPARMGSGCVRQLSRRL
jgi:hypothetical protein